MTMAATLQRSRHGTGIFLDIVSKTRFHRVLNTVVSSFLLMVKLLVDQTLHGDAGETETSTYCNSVGTSYGTLGRKCG